MRTSHSSVLLAAAALVVATAGPGCSGSVNGTGGSSGTSMTTSTGMPTSTSTTSGGACSGPTGHQGKLALGGAAKIDLLLAVDNSRSMADKQQILARAVPDLITGLVNPPCVDGTGTPSPTQPASPTDACPSGTIRTFAPVLDMHVGLVSSSLGSFGADGCPDVIPNDCPNGASGTSNNDHGHLVTRLDPCQSGTVPTYQGNGFLAWDPAQKLSPPGVSDMTALSQSVHDLVLGDGQMGCGFESQNESWYRFLVDPGPYASIMLNGQNAVTSGTDMALLTQRSQFLRPDSLLAIVVVTDETDTSLKEFGFYPLFAQEISNNVPFHLPHPRQECATKGPNDPCCGSCGQAPPPNCPVDPMCTSSPNYTDADENLAIRAFGLISHKQRYGIEFFYQPSRYVQALTSPTVMNSMNQAVPNPLFAGGRAPAEVFYAAITGVPWQLIARQKNGVPDLVNGVSTVNPANVGGFKTWSELNQKDPTGNTFWDDIAGDPEHYVPPRSPYMQESTVPRTGTDPITGVPIAPAGSPSGTSPLNGHERTITMPPGDIEYACIFPLIAPIDCSKPGAVCDCSSTGPQDNPLCDPNPNDGGNLTLQSRAKAYPGLKHLAIAKGLGSQGIVTSICAKQVTDLTQPDYGYRPAVKSILDTITPRLAGALGAQCLPWSVTPDTVTQSVPCTLVEARNTGGVACNCNTPGRSPVSTAGQCLVQSAMSDPLDAAAHWNCFCEISQLEGAAATSCENDPVPTGDGFCYVDATATPPIGNPNLVAKCPAGEQRQLRFVGQGAPDQGATVFVSCQ